MLRTARTIRAALACFALCSTAVPASAALTQTAIVPSSDYATVIRSVNPRVREEESLAYAEALLASARRSHVDPRLVMAIVTVESHWDKRAVSSSGARGLGQFLPGTAHDLGVDTRSPRSTLRGVTTYLHQLLTFFSASRYAMREAIAGYNAGPFAVRRHGIPRSGETPRYVAKVLSTFHAFENRLSPKPTVREVVAELDATQLVEIQDRAYWGLSR
ncbi:MAG: hypothetical protein NVSMB59_07140 [Vulcanimicrobiaceae bacterium]